MDQELRKALDTIDSLLVSFGAPTGSHHNPLWDILSAIRGPDNSDGPAKEKYTNPIREAAFPRLTEAGGSKWWRFTTPPIGEPNTEAHFQHHAQDAISHLDIATPEY